MIDSVIPAKAGYLKKKVKPWAPVFAGATMLWVFLSVFVHAGVGGGFYFWFVKREPPPIVADLDLSMTPLVSAVPNAGGGGGAREVKKWTLPKKGKNEPLPPMPPVTETKQEVAEQEVQADACPEPCPTATGTGSGWGGGSGAGEGEYVPAGETSRKPRWIRNFITSQDYPALARREGKDGRVVLTVLIDNQGRVRDARLLEGSYEVLNEVALRKIKEAVFTPAYNHQNKPVSCKVTLPIRFELR